MPMRAVGSMPGLALSAMATSGLVGSAAQQDGLYLGMLPGDSLCQCMLAKEPLLLRKVTSSPLGALSSVVGRRVCLCLCHKLHYVREYLEFSPNGTTISSVMIQYVSLVGPSCIAQLG